jgi:hypothetical protein
MCHDWKKVVMKLTRKDMQRFIGYAPQHDDMTMVVVKIR